MLDLDFLVRYHPYALNNDTNVWGDYTHLVMLAVRPKAPPTDLATATDHTQRIFLAVSSKGAPAKQLTEAEMHAEFFKSAFIPGSKEFTS